MKTPYKEFRKTPMVLNKKEQIYSNTYGEKLRKNRLRSRHCSSEMKSWDYNQELVRKKIPRTL